jgi:saccharopine dehydrogenase-like NADP-dependent oxidoreductase
MKNIVVFGAGSVARAHIRYLLDNGFGVTAASRTVSKAEAIVDGHPNGRAEAFDIAREPERLAPLVARHDLAVSLLPFEHHPRVAQICIEAGKHMVTTSYVGEPMLALDGRAKKAGVTLLNEIGVDPGIDHMTAMQVIHRVQKAGGEITSFTSYCGGLPAPEANDNPFGYKFSWSPRGVLTAGKNSARFRRDGELVEVSGLVLFDHRVPVPVVIDGEEILLEGYPNRDSLPYLDSYGIESARTMFRGTLRFPGWCVTLRKMVDLGWLDETERDDLADLSFAGLTARLAGCEGSTDLAGDVAAFLKLERDDVAIANLEWLGLFADETLPKGVSAPIDALTARMLERMSYRPGERDLLILQHEFLAAYPDHKERITSTMIDFGIPHGDSSMARTVGLPAAVGARMILEGRITSRGVLVPVDPEIYVPALKELQSLGIQFTERTETLA